MKIVAEKSRYHRFAWYFDYNQKTIEFARMLKESFGWERFSFNSDEGIKRWVFSDTFFVGLIEEKFPQVEVDNLVRERRNYEEGRMQEAKRREDAAEIIKDKKETDFKIKGIKGDMYPYQKIGVEFLVASGGRAIIADPPGLGKSLQSLGYVAHSRFERTLIICPATVKSSWENEIRKWTNLSYVIFDSKTKIADIPHDTRLWVINYDILKKHLPTLLKTRFDALIADEVHYCKNPQAIRTKVVKQLAKHVPHIVLLSGTPLLSRPVEMFTLLNMVDPGTWDNWFEYTRRYCNGHQGQWGYDASGATNTEELHERIRRYFIRRSKEEVLKQLPPKVRIPVPVDMRGEIAALYNSAEEDLMSYLLQYSGKQPAEIARAVQAERLVKLNILRQLCALSAVPTATALIESVLESGDKAIVFSSFVDPLKKLLEKFGDQAVILTGETPVEQRGELVARFQSDPNTKIFLTGFKSGGTGITLTAAQNTIFLDYPWNPSDQKQAEDRNHRPGQEAQSVNIYQLHARGTIADKMQKILERKQKVFDKVIEGELPESFADDTDTIQEVVKDIMERRSDPF
jgi:SWI/SNF-related matrix-associated actin-dependent regulator of chromatin subfamily A-like protein 1